MEPEQVSEEPKKPLINKWNPWEVRERTKAKILKLLSDYRDREFSVTEVADEIDANFQSVHIILLELALEHKITVRTPAEYRKVYKFNTDTAVKQWVEREIGTPTL